jgi:hypothetical protein
MGSILKKIGKGMIHFLAGVGVVKTIDGGLYLMTQPDDYLFFAGLGVLVLVGFFIAAGIVIEIENYKSNKNKNQKNDEH